MAPGTRLTPLTEITSKIHAVRGQRVILDVDLAELYGVETRVLNQAIKRNAERFPPDFAFQLTPDEQLLQGRNLGMRKEILLNGLAESSLF